MNQTNLSDALVQALSAIVTTYRNDPVGFARNVLGVAPDEWQAAVMRDVAAGVRRISIRAGHGVGKALRHDEPVLTPAGWAPISSMRAGDLVASADGTFTRITGVYPQGVRDLFRVVLDDGCSVVVDGDHLWSTTTRSERKHNRPGGVRTTREIASSLTFPNGPRDGLNHMIPTAAAIEHPGAVLPVEPYLFGVWLGNGSRHGRITATHEQVSSVAAAGGVWGKLGTCKHSEKIVYSAPSGLGRALRLMGMGTLRSHERYIPAVFLHASRSQRTALLQGILDTDGTVSPANNAVVLDITSRRLADGVSELVRSLGGVARRSEKQGMLYDKVCRWVYRVYISLPADVAPFRIPSKASRYKPDWSHKNRQKTTRRFIAAVEPVAADDAVCITVDHPSRLFVTRDHIVTHNSSACSWLLIWHMATRFPQKSICTAPTAGQLFDALFNEVKYWINKLPEPIRDLFEMTTDKITLKAAPEASFISARTSSADRPESLAGVHSDHVLLICDEASAIPEAVFESAAGSMSGENASVLLIGNPTRNTGLFFRTHHQLSSEWKTYHVSCLGSPRVAKDFVKQISDTYGPESNQYRVRVLGEFALREDDTLIPAELVDSAMSRDVALIEAEPMVYGIDVARFGDDRSVLCKRKGNVVLELRTWSGLDLMQLVGAIVNEAKADKPVEICVDSIGLGAGVADRLREVLGELKLKTAVRDVNVSESSAMNPQAAKLRDELWLALKDWLNTRVVKLPKMDDLRAEMVGPVYTFSSNGKIVVESKASMKKRGMRSPDLSDAVCLSLASISARVGGRSPRWQPGQPIRRNIRGVV